MKLNSISIRSRLFILLVGSILLWLIAGFMVLSMIDTLSGYQGTSRKVSSLPVNIMELENSVHAFYLEDIYSVPFYESGRSDAVSRFNNLYLETYTLLRDFRSDPYLNHNNILLHKLETLHEYLSSVDLVFGTVIEKYRARGWRDYGLCGRILEENINTEININPIINEEFSGMVSVLGEYLSMPLSSTRNNLANRVKSINTLLQENGFKESDPDVLALTGFLNLVRELISYDLELGAGRLEGLRGDINRGLSILTEESNAMEAIFSIEMDRKSGNIRWTIVMIIILSCFIFGFALYQLNRSVNRNFRKLHMATSELVSGKFPDRIPLSGNNEFSDIASDLNRFFTSINEKISFASALSEGKEPESLNALSQDDSLANALTNLQINLQSARQEEEKHRISREQRRWTNEGIARFGDILRIYNNDISSLCENIIRELVNYLEASAGGIFLHDTKEDESLYRLISSYAFDRKKYLAQAYKPGEGLIGTCAIEKEKIFLSEIPEDYISISSGFGESKPRCLLLVPLLLETQTLGVLEIASFKVFADFEVDFVEDLAGSIASAVSAVQMNMRTGELLEQSREQAREMAKQEEIMRQNMEELQTTQEESARRESEISGILAGIHNSSHVAEFNMDEELISINDKFLQLLESQRQQMLGKKYHEIIGVNRHTEAYKNFWQEIRDGNTVSRIDKLSLFTGQDIWLRQTFTPVLDSGGKLFKVLNIAADITETVEQKESLEHQANEIRRANIEMKSFSDAVDKALIKCVYSPTGQILELNGNFEQITGFTEKEMLGKNNRIFLQRVEKEQFDRIWEEILKDKPYSGVIRRTRPTGEEVWLMSTFTPVKDENGNIFKVFFLGQDITERKLKYQLLEEANKEIDRLRKQLDDS